MGMMRVMGIMRTKRSNEEPGSVAALSRWAGKRLWVAACLLGLGCGGPAVVPGVGSITLDGAPLDGVEVQFVPDPAKGPPGETATGQSDAQGKFTLKSPRLDKEGIVPGFYRVVVTDIQAVQDLTSVAPQGPGLGVNGAQMGKSRIQPIYNDLNRTPLRDIQVQAGSTPISLKLNRAPAE